MRRLTADQWFVGKEVREDKAPFGQPLYLNIQSLDVTIAYGLTPRLSISATLPFSKGRHSRIYADGQRHQVRARGIGDVSATLNYWLLDPATHGRRNAAVGVGVKTPSGRHDVRDRYVLADGRSTSFTVDQSIQLGDGGWGVILQAQAFTRLWGPVVAYASGSYLLAPANQTDVLQAPSGIFANVRVSVPDVYNARAGIAADVSHGRGLAVSLGVRGDGIPLRDRIGRSDGFRRPVLLAYLEPGVTFTRDRHTLLLMTPLRIALDFRRSLVDRQLGTAGGGDLAKYLIFAGYQIRF